MRHPKGARSIGIGHRFADDRFADTLLDPLNPLRVAEQKFPFPTPPLRSSHSPANLIVRHPCGVAGVVCDARSPLFAMSRLTSVLLKCVTPVRSPRGDAFELYCKEVTIPVAVQSRLPIPKGRTP